MLGVTPTDFVRLESLLRFRQGAAWAAARWRPGHRSGRAAASPERMAQAYGLLEATAQMSDEQIVKAYRRQMSRHHPDKLKANGLPDRCSSARRSVPSRFRPPMS
jgi:DnaJ like chaperone protein